MLYNANKIVLQKISQTIDSVWVHGKCQIFNDDFFFKSSIKSERKVIQIIRC